LETSADKTGVKNNNIGVSASMIAIIANSIITGGIEKNNSTIISGYNDINGIEEKIKYCKRNYNILVIVIIIRFSK